METKKEMEPELRSDSLDDISRMNLTKSSPCERDTQIDDMLFSDDSDEELSKMDTGVTTEDNFQGSPLKTRDTELDNFLLGADTLRSCFSKQFTLCDDDLIS